MHNTSARPSVGDRLLWRNPLGIGGVTVSALVKGVALHDGSEEPAFVLLEVEPSEPLRAVFLWAQETVAALGFDWPGPAIVGWVRIAAPTSGALKGMGYAIRDCVRGNAGSGGMLLPGVHLQR